MTRTRASSTHVATELQALISNGRWMPGDQLPSEAKLIERYSASRATVRTALKALAGQGLIASVQGSGWFVTGDQRLRFPLDKIDQARLTAKDDVWHQWVRSLDRVASHHLVVEIAPAPHDIARHLGIEADDLVVARRRIRFVDDEPWMLSTSFWPLWLAAGGPLADTGSGDAVDMRNPSPLTWAIQQGFPPLRDENEIGARMPTAEEAATLRMASAPVMTLHTTSWTTDERAIRCTSDIFPAHRFLLTTSRKTGYAV